MLNGVKHLIYDKPVEEDPSFLRMTILRTPKTKKPKLNTRRL